VNSESPGSASHKYPGRAGKWIVVLAFVAALWVPLLWAPATLPFSELTRASLQEATKSFAAKFPFSKEARREFDIIRYLLLRAVPPQYLVGRQGWVFYRPEVVYGGGDGEVLTDYLGELVPSQAVVQTWCDNLRSRRAWLEKRGIVPITIIAPNKMTVYGDYLPYGLASKYGRTRVDALMQNCKDQVIDVRSALSDARTQSEVYYPQGTHWTSFGAYVAYRAIAEKLAGSRTEIEPIPLTFFATKRHAETADAFYYILRPSPQDELEPRHAFPAWSEASGDHAPLLYPGWEPIPRSEWLKPAGQFLVTRSSDENLPTAVVFHDSFARYWLVGFLAQHFRRAVFVWGPFDPAIVERESPNVIVIESAERYFTRLVAPGKGQN
jgi:hypothetical protein